MARTAAWLKPSASLTGAASQDPAPTVAFNARLVACSGIPYTCCEPGKVTSNPMPCGPFGFESVCERKVSANRPSLSPSSYKEA